MPALILRVLSGGVYSAGSPWALVDSVPTFTVGVNNTSTITIDYTGLAAGRNIVNSVWAPSGITSPTVTGRVVSAVIPANFYGQITNTVTFSDGAVNETIVNIRVPGLAAAGAKFCAVSDASGGPDAAGAINNVNISGTSLVTIVSKPLTVAAGDTIRFELFGHVRNDTGVAQTLHLNIQLGSLALRIQGSATVATATDTPVLIRGYAGVVSSSQAYITAEAVLNPAAAEGPGGVNGITRTAWRQTTSDLTGAQVAVISGRGSTTDVGLTIRVAGYMIQKMQA